MSSKVLTIAMAGLSIISLYAVARTDINRADNIQERCKKEIKAAGTSDIDIAKIAKEADTKFFPSETTAIWQHACDSIKTKGLVDKAYLEGLNACKRVK